MILKTERKAGAAISLVQHPNGEHSFCLNSPPNSQPSESGRALRACGAVSRLRDPGWALLLFTAGALTHLSILKTHGAPGCWGCLFACRMERAYSTVYIRSNLSPSLKQPWPSISRIQSSPLMQGSTHTPHSPPPKLGTSLPPRAAIAS